MNYFFSFKNSKAHYTIQGKGSAVVLIHGFLANSTMWNNVSEVLSQKYRVVCIDLFGHGKTENFGYVHTMEDQARMVKAVLDHLKLRRYVMIGHSMGGYVSLSFAKLFSKNLKGLCLMNSTALPDSKEKKINRDRGIVAVKQNSKTFVRVAIPQLFSPKNKLKFKSEIEIFTRKAVQTSTQAIVAALEGMKIRKNNTAIYKTAKFPIQLIVGKQDPALDYASLIRQVNNTKVHLVEFPDGHMSHIENKMDLIKSLSDFIKKCK